jgi:predicted dehydrogenase
MTDLLTVGLVGCGAVVHTLYAGALRGRSAYAVRYVSDIVPEQAESAARLFGARIVSLEELVQRAGAVVLSTPPDTHAALLKRCIRPGGLVLCEKPFTTSYRAAVEIANEAASHGALLYVGQFRRTFPQVQLARSLVELGIIGDVTEMFISEGGRFTWKAVSDYPVKSEYGGVLWDTGPHVFDMALFGSGVDDWPDCSVKVLGIERDKPEPSHDFRARYVISGGSPARQITCRAHVSRKDVLPNFIRLSGERGSVAFSVGPNRHVRLKTARGSVVVTSDREHPSLTECFDLQIRRVFLKRDDQDFSAHRFLALTKILEALFHG